jgi:sulfur relay (sulfurtransferase) DsrC/TusE family protein
MDIEHEEVVKFMREFRQSHAGAAQGMVIDAAQKQFPSRDRNSLEHCYTLMIRQHTPDTGAKK